MSDFHSAGQSPLNLWSRKLPFVLILSAIAGFLAAELGAQNPPKKNKKEEEEETKPLLKPKKVLRAEDESQATGLALEAEQATHPELQSLFRSLVVPHDVVTLKSGQNLNVAPLAHYYGAKPTFQGTIDLAIYDEQWQPKGSKAITSADATGIDYYELIALGEVNAFLSKPLDQAAQNSKDYLSHLEMWQGAEKVLTSVLRFHESATHLGQRTADELDKPLRDKLLEIQLDQLRTLARDNNWVDGFDLALRLSEAYPSQEDIRAQIAEVLAKFVQQSLKEENYDQVHLRMKVLEDQFPHSHVLDAINQDLRQKAQAKYQEGVASKDTDPAKAVQLFREAETIWPRLPDVRNEILKLSHDYPVLYVGVRKLPEELLPATARSDSERQAVELLFESLIKPLDEKDVGQRYVPELVQDRPMLIPLGREFQLVRDAFWSNGDRLTATDVRQSWLRLNNQGKTGMIEDARIGKDAFHVNLTLRQGYLDPLSLMTFKILPATMPNPGDPEFPPFAKHPIGSGPYMYKERKGAEDIFIANPNFGRAGKAGLPRIREIHFVESKNPSAEIQNGPLQLVLNLPSTDVKQYQTLDKVSVLTMRNRRIYFLAINHRNPTLGQNQELRRAIAHVIDRDKILNEVFRERNESDPPHRPIYGPYPPGSWACKPDLQPFDGKLAKPLAEQAKGQPGQKAFSLKYPADDPQAAQACQAIGSAVAGLGAGFEIKPEPRTPQQLRDDVEVSQVYELAYYSYDYPTEAYYLWPLFDPQQMDHGGSNYLGFHDAVLEGLFRKAMEHRDFNDVKNLTYEIQEYMSQKMPLIPLWQLDTHLAIHADLTPKRIDPLLIFNDVENWELKTHQ